MSQSEPIDLATAPAPVRMRVRKRDGTLEPVDVNKIVRVVSGCSRGLAAVDPMRVAIKTVGGLYDGASTAELDELAVHTAAGLMLEEPTYSTLAARLLARLIREEVQSGGVSCFAEAVRVCHGLGLASAELMAFVADNHAALNAAIDDAADERFEYFGLRTLYDRYLLRNAQSRKVLETPQYFFLRVACGVSDTLADALALYELFSQLIYLPSSPTLFNAGSPRPQLSSCFLLDAPADDLAAIYRKYLDVALLSKHAGGIGLAYHRVRSNGSFIKGTNGQSRGIVPFLKTLDASVSAVNQGGKRKGACCVYLEPWHADILDFLALRDNTGDEARRCHNLNIANWIPDLFMQRVEADGVWSLFDPRQEPTLCDTYGEAFNRAFEEAERAGRYVQQMPARELYGRMMCTLAETGNGWICFKDAANRLCNQTGAADAIVHLSNLCTEIVEITSADETAVCNLGSINLARHVRDGEVDFALLGQTVAVAVRQLDRVIDRNLYPIESAAQSNRRWRPVGLGVMGLQDVFFRLRIPFDAPEAQALTARIAETIYYHALDTSCTLAQEHGPHPAFAQTRAAKGMLQPDLWGVTPDDPEKWERLRRRITADGLRNSLLVAIAPTATIAAIAGCYECIEPQVSNLFKRETLSGEFLQVNRYLVRDLQNLGLWTEATRNALKAANGSVQSIEAIPSAIRQLYRTAWELPMRALIDLAAIRGPYIDQSQSLNLFSETPNIGKLSSMYFYIWKKGLKTSYYLRSRPATSIAKTTAAPPPTNADAVTCSLENPQTCEACQ